MEIVLVGPAYPIKGGVAQHTTVLAQNLVSRGHKVKIVSWKRQYPGLLYPGSQTVAELECATSAQIERTLAWNRPDSWVRASRHFGPADLLIFAHVIPLQVPAYWTMMKAMRQPSVRSVVICHNVLPHERSIADGFLVRRLLAEADEVLVHSTAEEHLARTLSNTPVIRVEMPPFFPEAFVRSAPTPGLHRRLLFFGLVRPYKGLDVLLKALAKGPPDIRLRISGEIWGGSGQIQTMCRNLGIDERVEIRSGYVTVSDVPSQFEDVDALVLPYRSATGSQGVWLGHQFGVPVIASRVGDFANHVRPNVDGLLCSPDDAESLAEAIGAFYEDGVAERMRSAVTPVDPIPFWERYIAAVVGNVRATPTA